ncbi:Uncharacterized protein dnm_016430 [Desulfonema magnum]|uniref:Uncharacterized protein n=1 Tax=Desulfonema magnum TaxID=45655 RepID=A0A975GLC6_9BACT|nr:Uncharacterized protein dnm_016430 [Desulfonema magnum]
MERNLPEVFNVAVKVRKMNTVSKSKKFTFRKKHYNQIYSI